MKKQKIDVKNMTKEEKKKYLEERKLKRKQDTKKWLKNIGKSINQLWEHIGDEIPTLKVIDAAGKNLIDKKKRERLFNLSRLNKLTVSNIKELKKLLIDELELTELKDSGIYLGKEIIHRVKTGKLLENRNRQETARSNKDERDFNDLLDRLEKLDSLQIDDLESLYESYTIKGGNMLKNNLEMNKLRLSQYAFSEDFIESTKYSNTVRIVDNLVSKTLSKIALCESLNKEEVNDLVVETEIDGTRNEIKTLAGVLVKDAVAERLFNERLGDAYNALTEVKAVYELSDVNDDTIDKALEDIRKSNDDATSVGGVFADRVETVLEEDEEALEVARDDYVFDPIVDKDEADKENLVPVSEKKKASSESALLITGAASKIVLPAISVLNMLVHGANKHRTSKFAEKYGTNSGIRQPLVVSKSISKGLVAQLSKALEVKYALQVKALLESSVSAMDGGLVNKRLRVANFASPSKIDVKNAKLFARKVLSYDEVLSVFSEGKIDTDYVGLFTTDDLYILPAAMRVFSEKYVQDTILMREAMMGTGEAGIHIEEKRTALPTYLNVSIAYDSPDGKGGFKTATNDTVVGIEINPKMVSAEDLVATIKNNSFEKIKVTKDERTMMMRLKDMVNFWKTKPAKTESEKKIKLVADTKTFNEIASKVNNIKTPLFHVMMSHDDAADLKSKGIDIFKGNHYTRLMNNLPIISITVVNEDSGIVLMSEGSSMAYIKKDIEDFINSTSRLEKELRSEIKFRNNL